VQEEQEHQRYSLRLKDFGLWNPSFHEADGFRTQASAKRWVEYRRQRTNNHNHIHIHTHIHIKLRQQFLATHSINKFARRACDLHEFAIFCTYKQILGRYGHDQKTYLTLTYATAGFFFHVKSLSMTNSIKHAALLLSRYLSQCCGILEWTASLFDHTDSLRQSLAHHRNLHLRLLCHFLHTVRDVRSISSGLHIIGLFLSGHSHLYAHNSSSQPE
jgi:hypothetical protein